MNYAEARHVLHLQDETLDDSESNTIQSGSMVHEAMKILSHPTVIEHLVETGAVTYDSIFGAYQGRKVSTEEGKGMLLAPYKEPPVIAKLSDKECELILSLMHDGHKLDTFRSSATLRTLRKFTNLFIDACEDDTLCDYYNRHCDQLSDYCERMEKKTDEHYHDLKELANDCEDGYEDECEEGEDEDESSEPISGYCVVMPSDSKSAPIRCFPVYGKLFSDEFWKLFDIGKDGSSDDE